MIEHVQKVEGILTTDDPTIKEIINDERTNLNGDPVNDLDHETFYLAQSGKDMWFCKTVRKPYDLIVCSLLLLLHEHMPHCYTISSDGSYDDWKAAMELNAKVIGRGYEFYTKSI